MNRPMLLYHQERYAHIPKTTRAWTGGVGRNQSPSRHFTHRISTFIAYDAFQPGPAGQYIMLTTQRSTFLHKPFTDRIYSGTFLFMVPDCARETPQYPALPQYATRSQIQTDHTTIFTPCHAISCAPKRGWATVSVLANRPASQTAGFSSAVKMGPPKNTP